MATPTKQALVEQLYQALRRQSGLGVLFHAAIAERLGLGPTDHKCLDMLMLKGPLTAGQMAEASGLTSGAITGVVDRLERHGFVRRVADPGDRRRVIVEPVHDQAARCMAPLFEDIGRATGELLARYDAAQLVLILDFATRANAMLEAQIERLRAAEAPA